MAIYTMPCFRVNALPAGQEEVKVIVEPARRDRVFVAFDARVITQLVQRDRWLVIVTAVVSEQILGALG